MAKFVLIPGAGGMASYWSLVVPILRDAGHSAIAVDLPGDDEEAALESYADIVVEATYGCDDVVIVAQSLGGFTAAIVCGRVKVRALVFLNAMIPIPNETAGVWFQATSATKARERAALESGYSADFDMATYFFHDVPDDVIQSDAGRDRDEAAIIFSEPCRFDHWPDVPIHVLVGRDDRFFPKDFQRRIAQERLGLDVTELNGGHLVALSRPLELAGHLLDLL